MDEPPGPDSAGESGTAPGSESPDGTPRWVYVSGTIVGVLVVLFVILHLAGGGFRSHTQ